MKEVVPLRVEQGMSSGDSCVLFLCEPVSGVEVPIFIGSAEASSILLAKGEVQTRRPLTHELMVRSWESFSLRAEKVTIDRVVEGIFYATLYLTDGLSVQRLDCRTSDAVTVALLSHCPILMDERVMEETGVTRGTELAEALAAGTDRRAALEQELQRCEEREDYERAAQIMKEIEELKQSEE